MSEKEKKNLEDELGFLIEGDEDLYEKEGVIGEILEESKK